MKREFDERWEQMAIRAAMKSTCAKSRRGVVIIGIGNEVVSLGQNGPPVPFHCARNEVCRASCNKVAVHAEERAIVVVSRRAMYGADLVHVKVNADGKAVTSGPPSCWQCSRMILEAGIARVWLKHERGWTAYPAAEFHAVTLMNCGLPTQLKAP